MHRGPLALFARTEIKAVNAAHFQRQKFLGRSIQLDDVAHLQIGDVVTFALSWDTATTIDARIIHYSKKFRSELVSLLLVEV